MLQKPFNRQNSEQGVLLQHQATSEHIQELRDKIRKIYSTDIHRLDDDQRMSFLHGWLDEDASDQRFNTLMNHIWSNPYFYPFATMNYAESILKEDNNKDIVFRLSTTKPGVFTFSYKLNDKIHHIRTRTLQNDTIILEGQSIDITNRNFIQQCQMIFFNKYKSMLDPITYGVQYYDD